MNDSNDNFRRLLIVDDNEAIHGDYTKILTQEAAAEELDELAELDAELFGSEDTPSTCERTGFELTHVWQGKDAFQLLQTTTNDNLFFGAAFIDMRMPPGWDGVETIENLWTVDPDLQVVICTAYSDHSWEEITERLGKTDKLLVLKKPFDEIEVVQLATSLCEKRRLLELSKRQLNNLTVTVDQQAAQLEAAHENAETIIQSIASSLISLDENGNVSRWNQLATDTLGIPHDSAVGRPFTELEIAWSDPNAIQTILSTDSKEPQDRVEVDFTNAAGQTRTLEVQVCSIVNNPSSNAKLIVANDVTQQKLLTSQFDQAQHFKAMGLLAAGVAHEINTPMRFVGENVRFVAETIERMNQLLSVLPALVDESVSDQQLVEMR